MMSNPSTPVPATQAPQVAIVVPVFKHSVLVGEAITCALQQDTKFPVVVVIVNDGCPYPETDRICRDFAIAYPDRVVYLYRPNGGLSAARNTGINFVLSSWTSVEAIYLLDADNRISRKTIDRAFQELQSHPEIGWVYPALNMFGQEANHDYSGEYSVLRHLTVNICEAGSMVRRSVLEAGCRYDESMKLGFEDWEFWWQAIEAGFRGRYLPDFGFQYRSRPESMLKNSERDKVGILDYMRQKHRKLFTPHSILQLEHQEAPRYAIFLSDTERVVLTSDPTLRDRGVSLDKFTEQYAGAISSPTRNHRPYFMVYTHSKTLDLLEARGLVRWVFWQLEAEQESVNFSCLSIESNGDEGTLHFETQRFQSGTKRNDLDCQLVMTTVKIMDACLRDPKQDWIHSLVSSTVLPEVLNLGLTLPDADPKQLKGGAIYHLLASFKELRQGLMQHSMSQKWVWQISSLLERTKLFEQARSVLKSGVLYPIVVRDRQRHIGFVLPVVEFGGVEKVALNMAGAFKSAGWAVHLFVLNSQMQPLPEWAQIFDTINFYYSSSMNAWNGPLYMGSRYVEWVTRGDHESGFGLLSWLDAIVNLHSTAIHAVMGTLRRAGVKTIASLHVHDQSALNRPVGCTYLALGYEHAYDIVAPCSHKLLDWCHAIGIPQGKLIPVPNACGYPLPETTVQAILAKRWQRAFDGALKVLFIGRFDWQKGLDRLVEIITECRRQSLPIQWRLIGKSILTDQEAIAALTPIASLIEPPALTVESLSEAYEWADVLLLPSYWEGLPLTVLEAMRLGVVVCAADVGAVAEAVDPDQTGILIPNVSGTAFTEFAVNKLGKLAQEPDELIRIAKAAATVAAERSWQQACSELIDRLENLLIQPVKK